MIITEIYYSDNQMKRFKKIKINELLPLNKDSKMSVIYLKKNQCLWTAKGLNCYDIDSPSKLIRLEKLQTTLG